MSKEPEYLGELKNQCNKHAMSASSKDVNQKMKIIGHAPVEFLQVIGKTDRKHRGNMGI